MSSLAAAQVSSDLSNGPLGATGDRHMFHKYLVFVSGRRVSSKCRARTLRNHGRVVFE